MLTGVLYLLGLRTGRPGKPHPGWRSACFYAGLLTIFLALESPIDGLDGQLFWVHMVQHLLLIMVAAPLLVLGDPALPILRSSPLGPRRRVLKAVTTQSWTHRLASVTSRVASPWPAATIFLLDLYLWHWNLLFNLTLQNYAVHIVEHLCFLLTAVLLWSQVIEQRPVHLRLSYLQRAAYVVIVGAAGNLLAMYFVFTPQPLYSQYVRLSPRPFGMTALMDQQLAGALMWVPVLFVFAIAFSVLLYRWLGEEEALGSRAQPVAPAYRLLDGSLSTDSRSK